MSWNALLVESCKFVLYVVFEMEKERSTFCLPLLPSVFVFLVSSTLS